jgi:phosphonate transport system substrate-binding protein
MPAAAPARGPFRFALPPSVGQTRSDARIQKLREFLSALMERSIEVVTTADYRELTNSTRGGTVDVAWAPPFVAARLESGGLQVLLRGIRRGASTYRAALMASAPDASLKWLKGRRAVWVDPYSVSGCLLPLVFLKSKGFNPERDFVSQEYAGSFVAAVERVIAGKADVTSVFAPPPGVQWKGETGLEEMAPHLVSKIRTIAFTEEVPNSGLVASPRAEPTGCAAVRAALKGLKTSPDGLWLMEQLFQMDDFEDAPKMGYHALYRLAVASL